MGNIQGGRKYSSRHFKCHFGSQTDHFIVKNLISLSESPLDSRYAVPAVIFFKFFLNIFIPVSTLSRPVQSTLPRPNIIFWIDSK